MSEATQVGRRARLIRLLAEIYWNDLPPYPNLAVKAAADFLEKSVEEARAILESMG